MTSQATVLDLVRRLAPEGGRVLDAGCGDGALTVALTEAGYVALGIDTDLEAMRPTSDAHPKIPFFLDDLTEPDLPMAVVGRGFDVVVLKDVVDGMGLAALDAALATTARVAAVGGALVASVPPGMVGTFTRTAEKAGWREESREEDDVLVLRRRPDEPTGPAGRVGRLASILRR